MNRQPSPRNHETIEKTQKILSLQQELLSVRKEMSRKQSQWEKQKSNLLSKNEVANIQIIELKQRIANLTKINETLSNAMTNSNEAIVTEKSSAKIKKPKQLIIGEEASDFSCDDSRKQIKYQEEVKRLSKIIHEKDGQINNLSKIGDQLRARLQERNILVRNLQENCYDLKKSVEKKQEQILKLHQQIQKVEERLEQNNQYIDETRRKSSHFPQNQKRLLPQQLDESASEYVKKYTKNSSYLMLKPTPDHSAYDIDTSSQWNDINLNQGVFESEQEQKLLCEVCNRVFTFAEFQDHVEVCGHKIKNQNTKHLFQKKKEIQSRLERIRLEQEKENMKTKYYKNEPSRFQFQDNKDKIMQIRQIAKGLTSNKRDGRKNSCNDFSIKSNAYYY